MPWWTKRHLKEAWNESLGNDKGKLKEVETLTLRKDCYQMESEFLTDARMPHNAVMLGRQEDNLNCKVATSRVSKEVGDMETDARTSFHWNNHSIVSVA